MPSAWSALLILLIGTAAQAAPQEVCSVTKPPSEVFVPPPPYAALPFEQSTFYFGSDGFWTILPNDGVWFTQHDTSTYDRRKIVWFSKNYWLLSRKEDDLVVDAKRLDGAAEAVRVAGATNGFIPERQESFMLNSIEFPTTGCWEISASYYGHELKFVVWVTPYTASSN
jgi:hypothetical protein